MEINQQYSTKDISNDTAIKRDNDRPNTDKNGSQNLIYVSNTQINNLIKETKINNIIDIIPTNDDDPTIDKDTYNIKSDNLHTVQESEINTDAVTKTTNGFNNVETDTMDRQISNTDTYNTAYSLNATKILNNAIENKEKHNVSLEPKNIIQVENTETNKISNIAENNVIILGSKASPDKLNNDNVSKKRHCKTELESLGITEFISESAEFDVCTDSSNRFYKKYKLRDSAKKPDYRIPSIKDLPELSSKRTDNEEISCPICNHTVFNIQELRSHMRSLHKLKFTCSLCTQTFNTNNELVSHKTVHATENHSFLCKRCKVAFSNQYDYLTHKITHLNPNTIHECIECGLSYGKSYAQHLATHFDLLFTCPLCSKVIRGEINLKRHIKSHDQQSFDCIECGKVLRNKKAHEYHLAIHTGVKIYQCLYCGKGFRVQTLRTVHMRTHIDLRLYSCMLCSKKFTQSSDLQRHLAAHNKVKNFECGVCGKKYLHKMDLTAHKRVHSNNIVYNCPECGKRVSSMCGLRTHVLFKHTTERTVECNYCDKKFINKNQYQKHARSLYHKNNVYKASLNKNEN